MTAAVLSAAFLKAPARPGLVNSSVSGAASPPGGGTIDTARGRDGDDGDDGEDGDTAGKRAVAAVAAVPSTRVTFVAGPRGSQRALSSKEEERLAAMLPRLDPLLFRGG